MSTANCSISQAFFDCQTADEVETNTIQLKIYDSIKAVPQQVWNNLTREDELFLCVEYLEAFEASVSNNVSFRYVLFQEHNNYIGLACFQMIRFDAKNIKNDDASRGKRLLAKSISAMSFNILLCGNAFMTGEYGVWFGERKNSPEQVAYLKMAIEKVKQEEKQRGKSIDVLLVKDFFEDQEHAWDSLSNEAGFMKFQVQPNMIFTIDKAWGSFDGYLDAMTSKHRTRIKRAIKDFTGITVKPLSLQEVKENMPLIEDLYNQVIGESSFKLATFDIKHLVPMFEKLGDKFEVSGYYLNNELVAFTSSYKGHDNEMVAGMLGYSKDLQRQYDLYYNMLIQIAKQGIEQGFDKIVMGRTAMGIKSSLGAEPEDMTLYIMHTNKVVNAIAKPIMQRLIQQESWDQRRPFKNN